MNLDTLPRPLVVAHRGQAGSQENTLAAFIWAIEQGSPMIELDVRRCGDGSLVIHHDAHIAGIPLSTLSWLQLQAYKPVPTLAETLALAQGRIRLDIELKEGGYEKEVIRCLEAGMDPQDLLVTSFDPAVIQTVKQLQPNLTVGLLVDRGEDLVAYAQTWLKPTGAEVILPHGSYFDQPLEMSGIPLLPWTINDWGSIEKILGIPDVLGVITDHPDQVLAQLKEKK